MRRPASSARALLGFLSVIAWLLAAPAHAQVSLGTATNFPAGTNPIGIAIGDVNRDGRPDIVVTNGTPGTISVLLATGDGTFGAPTAFTVGTMPIAVALGDLNRDGILDAVVVNAGSNSISILLGNATGGFGAQTVIPVGVGPTAVAIGDLDGDGRLDVVVTNGGSGTVMVLRGNGIGGLTLVGEFPTGAAPSSVVLADVNADNLLDVIVGNRDSSTVSVFPGVGSGLLGPPVDLADATGIRSVAVGDFNRDGRPDIVAGPGPGGFSLQLSDGAGGFRRGTNFTNSVGVVTVAFTDFDGDGRLDLVLLFTNGATNVLRGDGVGAFLSSTSVSGTANPSALALGDFDRDGLPDLVVVNPAANAVTVRLNTTVPAPAGSFTVGTPIVLPTPFGVAASDPVAVLLADVGSLDLSRPGFDGALDAVVVDAADVRVELGPVLQTLSGAFSSDAATVALLADVNGDGRPDLLLGHASSTLSVRLGSGQGFFGTNLGGTFGPSINSGLGITAGAIAVGDLDRDGRPDLVAAGINSTLVSVLRGLGGGVFSANGGFSNIGVASGGMPTAVALADLDRNGTLDLIVGHTNGVSVFPGDGAGRFGAETTLATGVSAVDLAVGDLNRDGKLDVVFSTTAGSLQVLLGNGTGGVLASIVIPGFITPGALGLADLNRDGVLDLVVLDSGAGTLLFLPGVANATLGVPTVLPAGPTPAAFAIGDVNADGRLDLVVLSSDRRLRVLLNDGAGAGTIAFATNASTSIGEAGGTAVIAITRSGGTASATVDLTLTGTAVFGVDYQLQASDFTALPASGTLTFAPGETTKQIFLTPAFFADSVVNQDRTIVLTLSNPGGGAALGTPSQRTVTVTDRDEALSFSQPTFAVAEGGQATVTVNRRGDLQGTVTVGFKTVASSASATDFVSTTGTLTFPPGVAQKTFTVKANADALREGDETVALLLTSATSSVFRRVIRLESPSAAQLTVIDGNAAVVGFASATASVAEGATISVTLTRTGALAETATAGVFATPLSASASDFTISPPVPTTIVFAPGVTSQSIQITATTDNVAEGPETFRLQLMNVSSGGRPGGIGANPSVLVTIVDDESAFGFTDTFANRQIPESAPTATFTVQRSGPLTATATVQASTVQGGTTTAVPGQDYQIVAPTTLTFPPGVATRTFSVPLLNDTVVDGAQNLAGRADESHGRPGHRHAKLLDRHAARRRRRRSDPVAEGRHDRAGERRNCAAHGDARRFDAGAPAGERRHRRGHANRR